jgi:hypothetical protein
MDRAEREWSERQREEQAARDELVEPTETAVGRVEETAECPHSGSWDLPDRRKDRIIQERKSSGLTEAPRGFRPPG